MAKSYKIVFILVPSFNANWSLKIGGHLLGKLTICIVNVGSLRGHCMVAMNSQILQYN